ncbi:MAG: rhodanese-like domain-containing protein [Spirochaetales bacterium]|nr:rhodanese-like domain-containing protein [Spirochaetales bacterium]
MDPITLIVPVAILVLFKIVSSKGNIKPAQLKEVMANGGKIIDVRSSMEYKSGHVKNALNIEHGSILNGVKKNKIKKETPLILYCASGSRSSVACSTLKSDGFTNVYNAGTKFKMEKLIKSL